MVIGFITSLPIGVLGDEFGLRWTLSGVAVILALFTVGGTATAATAAPVTVRLHELPLQQAVAASQRVARGDLTVELQARGRDETAELLRALGRPEEPTAPKVEAPGQPIPAPAVPRAKSAPAAANASAPSRA